MTVDLQGLRTVVYPAPDLDQAKRWWTSVLGKAPYFDQPFYVGYNVAGYELALDPDGDPQAGAITYWGVADVGAAVAALESTGATLHEPVREVGGGIEVATVKSPQGTLIGLIDNPHFTPEAAN